MSKCLFITGTDTDIGKTKASIALLKALKQQGIQVAAMKPVASGCESSSDGLRNDDALQLMQQACVEIDYDTINPYAFEAAIAPHIAAQQHNTVIDLKHIKQCYQYIADRAEVVLVEGAGGCMAPLNESHNVMDIAKTIDATTILVVGMRLGCLNHAMLSMHYLQTSGIVVGGWIANFLLPDFTCKQQNLEYLQRNLGVPLIATLEHNQTEFSQFDLTAI